MIKFLFKEKPFNWFDLLLIASVSFVEQFTLLFWVWIIGGSIVSVIFGGSDDDVKKLQAEITKIRQGEKDMRDTITLYDKTITRIAHHIQDQGNAKHFCTSGIDFDDGTAKEICDYITKINEELNMSHSQLPTVSSGSHMPKVKTNPNIIQFQAMPNDAHWQGCILGLADDGKIYISEHDQNGSRWVVYIED